MESFRNQRLRDVVAYLKENGTVYNNEDFYRKLGKNRSQMCETLSGRRGVTDKLAESVAAAFPEINPVYLTDRSCEQMIADESQRTANVKGSGNNVNNGHDQHVGTDCSALLKTISDQQKTIDRLLAIIERMQG